MATRHHHFCPFLLPHYEHSHICRAGELVYLVQFDATVHGVVSGGSRIFQTGIVDGSTSKTTNTMALHNRLPKG